MKSNSEEPVSKLGSHAKRGKPIQVIGSIHAIDSTGTSTISIDTIRGHGTYDIGVTNEIRAAGIAEAGTAGIRIIGKQQREIACKPCVNLKQVGASQHAYSLIVFLP